MLFSQVPKTLNKPFTHVAIELPFRVYPGSHVSSAVDPAGYGGLDWLNTTFPFGGGITPNTQDPADGIGRLVLLPLLGTFREGNAEKMVWSSYSENGGGETCRSHSWSTFLVSAAATGRLCMSLMMRLG